MAIPGPGTAISINTIATEFGGTVPHSLSEYYRGGGLVPNTPGNAAIPTSGQIALGDFYGSANRTQVALTIAADTLNYDVYTNRTPGYVAGSTDLTVTVNAGVTVGSATVPAYAMLVPSAFSPADTVTIINNGVIQGMGGTGGAGASVGAVGVYPGGVGNAGGSALYVNRPTIVTNNGTVAGGGGGGGAGGGKKVQVNPMLIAASGGGGGGGGSGRNGGVGGAGGGTAAPGNPRISGSPGRTGTSPAGGAGGAGGSPPAGYVIGGTGGTGGGRGAVGATGGSSTSPSGTPIAQATGGGGGAAGNYIVGNPFVTWPATGTRQGGVA